MVIKSIKNHQINNTHIYSINLIFYCAYLFVLIKEKKNQIKVLFYLLNFFRMETWPDEVTRAVNRSKFARDETKKYELIIYKPIQSILQEGPQ